MPTEKNTLAQKVAHVILAESFQCIKDSVFYGVYDVFLSEDPSHDNIQLVVIHNLKYLTEMSDGVNCFPRERFFRPSSIDILWALGSRECENIGNPDMPELEELIQMPSINKEITAQEWVVLERGAEYVQLDGRDYSVLLRRGEERIVLGQRGPDIMYKLFLEMHALTKVRDVYKYHKCGEKIQAYLTNQEETIPNFTFYFQEAHWRELEEVMSKEIEIHALHIDALQLCDQQGSKMRKLARKAYQDKRFWPTFLARGKLYDVSRKDFTVPVLVKYPHAVELFAQK